MRLTAFQSDKGDCLLLESNDGENRILVDGGMRRAYSEHVSPALGALRTAKKDIDVAYISHIDEDHISGMLQLLDDEADWRVHEHQIKNGNPKHKEPVNPRPPKIKQIWHNSFHDQVKDNTGDIGDMLAATATILLGSSDAGIREIGDERRELATSIPQALQVSSRIKPGQLNIPLNRPFKGKLMMADSGGPSTISIGSMDLTVIGPFAEDVDNLRHDWNEWPKKNQATVKRLRSHANSDEDQLRAGSVEGLFDGISSRAAALAEMEVALRDMGANGLALKVLGNRSKVTAPNLASLMFFVKEGKQTMLLTGDGHWKDILNGLEGHKLLKGGKLHVDVLKAQHHGSEHNFKDDFCDVVTADDYVFCGNGQHENPDLDVLQMVVDRRIAAPDRKAYRFWFNSSSTSSFDAKGRAHMKKVETLMAKLKTASGGKATSKFLNNASSMKIV